MKNCCDTNEEKVMGTERFESISLPLTNKSCSLCEDYASSQSNKEYAVLSCEGACLRGEIARQVANIICFEKAPDKTVRICMGGAFTKDAGQRELVRKASKIISIEGCPIDCANRTMRAVLPEITPIVVETDRLAEFNKEFFGVNEMSHADIMEISNNVAERIAKGYIE